METLLGNKVLVKGDDPTITESGILLEMPNPSQKQRSETGEIVLVGTKLEYDLKVGDKIHFNKMAAKEFHHNGKDYLIVAGGDINGFFVK
jgi:co-chaperonin GroES (HSP10)